MLIGARGRMFHLERFAIQMLSSSGAGAFFILIEVKMVKQMEKEAKKNLKKQAKLEKQKSGSGKKGEVVGEEDDEE